VRPYLELNPHLIVGVAGCVAQQEKGNLFKRFPYLDMVFGPDVIGELPNLVVQARANKNKIHPEPLVNTAFNSRQDFEFINLIAHTLETRVKAFVNIQKGCDNICSFCIVPFVRGREVSRSSHEILDEVKQLVDLGVKEVTLLGQNVNSYGLKTPGELTFPGLLEKIAAETKLKRLRFTTSHPKDVGEDLMACFRDIEMLSPYFHLPVQSGSDRILKAMRRHYTRSDYLKKIEGLKKARPDLVFSTDFMVGFPGEDSQDFEASLSLLAAVDFDFSFSFAYSARPYTTASQLSDQFLDVEKARRLEILLARQRQISARKNKALENTVEEVLIECLDELRHNWVGRTATNKITHIAVGPVPDTEKEAKIGEVVQVRIIKGMPHSLVGEVISHE
jgi:tRNA-2-methylthio-N6-dimethylallyladenosine synthase